MGAWFGGSAIAGVLGGVAGGAAFGALYALLVVTLARRSDRLRRRAQPARRRAHALPLEGDLRLVVELAAHRRLGRGRHAPHRAHRRRSSRSGARRRLPDAVRPAAARGRRASRSGGVARRASRRAFAGSRSCSPARSPGSAAPGSPPTSAQFVAGMSNGRGYIALAAMIFGGWRPVRAGAGVPALRRRRGAADRAAGRRRRRARLGGADAPVRADDGDAGRLHRPLAGAARPRTRDEGRRVATDCLICQARDIKKIRCPSRSCWSTTASPFSAWSS